ncbi:MAG: hypothetical protein Q4C47_01860, partial [Planctomycetia bacterium]|nr:hypothetical protein [Planctomycetia bacterium]
MVMNSSPVEPEPQMSSGPDRPSKHRTLRPTILDFALLVVAPVLVTIALWSLIIAFLTVLNHFGIGAGYEFRLRMALMCFAMGVVAACRIGMTMTTTRAMIYSVVLYFAGSLMMSRFFPQMPLLLQSATLSGICGIGFLLTYDSTWMPKENADQDGGILQRIRRREYIWKLKHGMAKKEDDPDRVDGRLAQSDPMEELRRKIPHRPGMAVLWFSLVILPILSIAQGLLPEASTDAAGNVTDGGGRLVILECTVVYVVAVLGLLMATSFIGLRRYLRFRRIDMPPVIVKRWFSFGGVLLIFLTIATLAIPRPAAEYSLAQFPGIRVENTSDSGEKEKNRPDASRVSVGHFDPGRDTKDADRTLTGKQAEHTGNQIRSGAQNPGDSGGGQGKGEQSGTKDGRSRGNPSQGNQTRGNPSREGRGEKGAVSSSETEKSSPENRSAKHDGQTPDRKNSSFEKTPEKHSRVSEDSSSSKNNTASDGGKSSETDSDRSEGEGSPDDSASEGRASGDSSGASRG